MKFPKVSVIFKGVASTAISRGDRGVVALVLKDSAEKYVELNSIADMPSEGLSDTNKKYVQHAFIGGYKAPRKVVLVITTEDDTDYAKAMKKLQSTQYDYLAIPNISEEDVSKFASFIKSERDTRKRTVKAVLPHIEADHEGIIDFETDDIVVGEKTYSATEYTPRIAGICAGTPMNTSCTFFPLPEVDDVPALTDEEKDAAIEAGKLILINDGRQVKIARGINSLKTITDDKPSAFQKIKLLDIIDLIKDDITKTCEDNYVGKVTNDYDHQCLLISAIKGYFRELEEQGLLSKGGNNCEYDVESRIEWLKTQGKYKDGMSENEVKAAYQGDVVFLKASITLLDVMEEINIVVSL